MTVAAVGIPTYNRHSYLPDALTSLAEQTKIPDTVHLLDDSEDGLASEDIYEAIETLRAIGITVSVTERGGGTLMSARNQILKDTSADIICFIDDDVVCSPSWFETILDTFANGGDVVAVGGPAILVDNNATAVLEIDTNPSNQNIITGCGVIQQAAHYWIPPQPVVTDHLIGANMAFHLERIPDLSFDESYGGTMISEDTDVFGGIEGDVVYHPDARVDHFEADTGGTEEEAQTAYRQEYWRARNQVRFISKHYPGEFWRGIYKFSTGDPHRPGPLWKQLMSVPLRRSLSAVAWVPGVLDGIRFETA